ncbi:methylated-DNA--[protein]-cysteine S-methyltransferase [Bacillus carboniphilus]|uniref:Methylated-DNA--protein-cysteine methyltransferase n=1 Tax=Bacillus carboniphilus TaxID=86663 RepID=A0ABY9JX63_9BACI|nr:methylated-DNA--[protein]-cysteine S-methyltransferase [Bacillus carboniphilus]WLR43373.1 methylated-DNA--[protein]-cysteine S-methyltransferase [Bacillus carboniphilus]
MCKQYMVDYKSPIGMIEIGGSNEVIFSILFSDKTEIQNKINGETPNVIKECYKQLDEYFNGQRMEFNIPSLATGTTFQKEVWNALTSIPYAKTSSYKDIAAVIGNEKAVRAVGTANSKNQLSIIVPCHRIIGANGKLTGYAGGLWRKEWLLNHERNQLKKKL